MNQKWAHHFDLAERLANVKPDRALVHALLAQIAISVEQFEGDGWNEEEEAGDL